MNDRKCPTDHDNFVRVLPVIGYVKPSMIVC